MRRLQRTRCACAHCLRLRLRLRLRSSGERLRQLVLLGLQLLRRLHELLELNRCSLLRLLRKLRRLQLRLLRMLLLLLQQRRRELRRDLKTGGVRKLSNDCEDDSERKETRTGALELFSRAGNNRVMLSARHVGGSLPRGCDAGEE